MTFPSIMINPENTAFKRRQFIVETLERDGSIFYRQIHAAFPNTKAQSIIMDYEALMKAGHELERHQEGRETVIYSKRHRRGTTKEYRSTLRREEKHALARVAASLVMGPEIPLADTETEERDSLFEQKNLETALSKMFEIFPDSTVDPRRLLHLFQTWWREPQRVLALDAGTTTESVQRIIGSIGLPYSRGRLTHLHAFTNSREIFYRMGDPLCDTKAIIIGGEQRLNTEAISGEYSRMCLESWKPSFGMAIIGATDVDTKRYRVGCDNDNEAWIKKFFLSQASIRIVVADHTKFSTIPMASAYTFSPINSDHIDLIVSDKLFTDDPDVLARFPVPIITEPALTALGL